MPPDPLPSPSPEAHDSDATIARTRSSSRLETHELHRLRTPCSGSSDSTTSPSRSPSPSPSPLSQAQTRRSAAPPPPKGLARVPFALKEFWRQQISIVVDIGKSRDHLAVERTFLGYLRTSQALSMFGVIVAQLFSLQRITTPNGGLSYFVVGKPLAAICQGGAMYILLLGAYRWWRQQKTMLRGKVLVGGFELSLIGLGILLICVVFFALMIAIDVKITNS